MIVTITAREFRESMAEKPRKYRNKPVTIDGFRFDSQKEGARYGELLMQQRAGLIGQLEVHPRFELHVNGCHIGFYRADFAYVRDGKGVVEDVKSEYTRRLRGWARTKRLMWACHRIEVVEV